MSYIQIKRILPITWLFSSILFFLIVTVAGPDFWLQPDKAEQVPRAATGNWLFGLAGIIVYFSEPVIWRFLLLRANQDAGVQDNNDDPLEEGVFQKLLSALASILFTLIIMLPTMVLSLFKPVFRALVLYTSLGNFGSMRDDTPLYKFFIVIVTIDILLYYLDGFAPEWKYNPVNALTKRMRLLPKPLTGHLANLLLVIHTALIYTLLLGVVAYDISHHPEKNKFATLALWWFILTVYTRLAFISANGDHQSFIKNISLRIALITFITLTISFISFIWPFYLS